MNIPGKRGQTGKKTIYQIKGASKILVWLVRNLNGGSAGGVKFGEG